jgi:hypothetical protein
VSRGSVKQSLTCINIPLNEFSTTRNRDVVYIFWHLEGKKGRGEGCLVGRGSVKQSLTSINIPLNEFSTTRNRYVVYIFWL